MADLSILIPARNERFLSRTVEDILRNITGRTEVLVALDGASADPPLPEDERVRVLRFTSSIGQRAATNRLAELSRAKYLMKVDAHCAFDQGFDEKMMRFMQDDWTMVPVMRNLHAFDWVCPAGHRRYQSPSGPCQECGKPTVMDVVWIAKTNPQSTAYRFDRTMHFQYWREYGKQQKGDITESMSIQGSCFMVTRAKYWELDLCSESFHSWGQQGVEVACKTWLSGGRVVVNRTTWYAHMFRTQGGDFGFPYPLEQRDVDANRVLSRNLFMHNQWSGAKRPFQWLIDKFNPPEWEDYRSDVPDSLSVTAITLAPAPAADPEPLSIPAVIRQSPRRGILYYTDNALNMRMARTCRTHIVASGLPVTSVTLKPTNFGRNIHVQAERSYKTMFLQILTGLEAMTEDIVYFCEHDVLYHRAHFEFVPSQSNVWYYNGNYWVLRLEDGFAVHYDVSPLSGLVVYREPAITHFRERLEMIKAKGFGYYMGFEPFTHRRIKWKNWYEFEVFKPEFPNIDLAHRGNLTTKRFSQSKFIRKPKFWVEGDVAHIPGWPDLPSIVKGFDR